MSSFPLAVRGLPCRRCRNVTLPPPSLAFLVTISGTPCPPWPGFYITFSTASAHALAFTFQPLGVFFFLSLCRVHVHVHVHLTPPTWEVIRNAFSFSPF